MIRKSGNRFSEKIMLKEMTSRPMFGHADFPWERNARHPFQAMLFPSFFSAGRLKPPTAGYRLLAAGLYP